MNDLIGTVLPVFLLLAVFGGFCFTILHNWKFIVEILWGKNPPVAVKPTRTDDLNEESLTRGTLVIGDPGQGKTEYVSNQIYKKFKEHPEQAIFVFDWSGGLTNAILRRISHESGYASLLKRVVLDELGNDEVIIPKPEFHPDYGLTEEEQVNRVIGNMERLVKFLLEGAPFLTGVSIDEIGRNIFRILTAIETERGKTWQITEAKRLVMDLPLLREAVRQYGGRQPNAKWYFEHEWLPKDIMKTQERELTSRALRYILGKIEGRETRATLGYFKPGWTPKEATEKGLMVLIDAHKMINQPEAQHYLLMQNFSLVMAWINKRELEFDYYPVMIAFDETYTILKIPGMAEWLGYVSPLYRSRKIQLLIIIQALWQLDENFAKQIWTLGNIVSFAISNSDEAQEIAKQLFMYDPKYIKNAPKTPAQNPTTEPVTGQDRIIADWIQNNLKARQLIMRRYETEQKKEKGVVFVQRTTETPNGSLFVPLSELKEALIRARGIPVGEALDEIGKRKLTKEDKEGRPII